jgi:WhiB family transcriptional regulator, redox-sensing transcriptional regulator
MLMVMTTTTSSSPVRYPQWPASQGTVIELRKPVPARSPLQSTAVPCQQEDPALWFSNVPAELNLAKSYCRGCRNRQSCLAGAIERSESAGVWGGEIFERGQIIPLKRPRGRPRKSSAAGVRD